MLYQRSATLCDLTEQYYGGTVAKFGNRTQTRTYKVKRAEVTSLTLNNTIDFFSWDWTVFMLLFTAVVDVVGSRTVS